MIIFLINIQFLAYGFMSVDAKSNIKNNSINNANNNKNNNN